ncbi:unnamed protein product [Musa acuminata subsp. malaccensis]|uniref:(wild Malaysian banana) hypothetical protein n=1 Tax=Musa acuminata subsp. malaccensis TaxID=214687 RepID=A0A804JYR9_MUSAM|nr:unnamed protein product [Musa acuminata subsp. malaccensis]
MPDTIANPSLVVKKTIDEQAKDREEQERRKAGHWQTFASYVFPSRGRREEQKKIGFHLVAKKKGQKTERGMATNENSDREMNGDTRVQRGEGRH